MEAMDYWGKIIGGLAGLLTRQPLLVLLGVFLGHQFDRGFAERIARFREDEQGMFKVPDGFVNALFQVMGHMAKADGRVTDDEIRAARSLMHRLNMGPQQIRHAMAWFTEGKQPGFQMQATILDLRAKYARRPELRSLFVRLLMEVSLSKNSLQQVERNILWSICKTLDIGRVELAQLEAMLRAQRGFRKSPQGGTDAARVNGAYRSLGMDQSATNAEIKKAYRRLMNKHHPDKIMSANPDDAVIDEAERMTREIRSAYELLKTRRSIR
jgi:DnaJ like chaperone protein